MARHLSARKLCALGAVPDLGGDRHAPADRVPPVRLLERSGGANAAATHAQSRALPRALLLSAAPPSRLGACGGPLLLVGHVSGLCADLCDPVGARRGDRRRHGLGRRRFHVVRAALGLAWPTLWVALAVDRGGSEEHTS